MTVQVEQGWLSSGSAELSQPRSVPQGMLSGLGVVEDPLGKCQEGLPYDRCTIQLLDT